MKAIILAAGKGTRFGEITKKTPKSLIKVTEKPILEYILSALPDQITEVIIAIGHLGDHIKNRFRNKFDNINIKYLELKKLNGTAGVLWAARSMLSKEKFLVLNGDDIYSKEDLKKLLGVDDWAFGLSQATPPSLKYLSITLDKNQNVIGSEYPQNLDQKILMATGAYVLDYNIFKYKPVPIGNGKELGLPQTILKATNRHPTRGLLMPDWIQINNPEDIKNAERKLRR